MVKIAIGYILDLIIGEPNNPYHPVRYMAALGSFLENKFRKILKNNLKLAGLLVWIITVSAVFLINFGVVKVFYLINKYLGILVEGVLIYFCISSRGLRDEGLKVVAFLLKGDLEGARHQLSYIVGRDTKSLDEEAILKAVVETIAENLSDGVIAPLIFAGLGGAPLAMAYKAINTQDSMFGYKNEKYMDFGYFPAKLDDVFNYIPARLTSYLIIFVTGILRYRFKNSIEIYNRDKNNHTSPNSAHPEAAMAGALGVQLGGPNYYFGKLVEKPTIGDVLKSIEINDVYKTNKILYVSTFLGVIISIIINVSIWGWM